MTRDEVKSTLADNPNPPRVTPVAPLTISDVSFFFLFCPCNRKPVNSVLIPGGKIVPSSLQIYLVACKPTHLSATWSLDDNIYRWYDKIMSF